MVTNNFWTVRSFFADLFISKKTKVSKGIFKTLVTRKLIRVDNNLQNLINKQAVTSSN